MSTPNDGSGLTSDLNQEEIKDRQSPEFHGGLTRARQGVNSHPSGIDGTGATPRGRGMGCAHEATPHCRSRQSQRGGAPVHLRCPRIGTAGATEGPKPQRIQQHKEALPCTSKGVFRAHRPHCLMCACRSARNVVCSSVETISRQPPRAPCREALIEERHGDPSLSTRRCVSSLPTPASHRTSTATGRTSAR